MNFEDLLDENGEGSRELDAWLAENIHEPQGSNKNLIKVVEREKYSEDNDYEIHYYKYEDADCYAAVEIIPNYTTGDSIDPIWNLAKEYFDSVSVRTGIKDRNYAVGKFDVIKSSRDKKEFTNINSPKSTEQLAIADALFKAYQEKEDGE